MIGKAPGSGERLLDDWPRTPKEEVEDEEEYDDGKAEESWENGESEEPLTESEISNSGPGTSSDDIAVPRARFHSSNNTQRSFFNHTAFGNSMLGGGRRILFLQTMRYYCLQYAFK